MGGQNGGMLLFILLPLGLAILSLGALVFLVCAAIDRLRQYALSASLWCLVWAPCMLAAIAAGALLQLSRGFDAVPKGHPPTAPQVVWVCFATVVTAAVATSIAWMHQAIIRRMTLELFRMYAALVLAGIGSVWGWDFGAWVLWRQSGIGKALWMPVMMALVAGFWYAGWRGARGLRGPQPERFAWVTREEFEGVEVAGGDVARGEAGSISKG